MASPSGEFTASEYVRQAETIADKISGDWKETVKSEISKSMQTAPNATFVYLLSNTWLDQWKEMSGFDDVKEGISVNEAKLPSSKQLPRLNADIVNEYMTQNIAKISRYNPSLEYLDVVVKKGIIEDNDFVYVHAELWSYFKKWFPDSIEVKRKAYINSHKEISYEVNCHLVIHSDPGQLLLLHFEVHQVLHQRE